MKWRRFSRSVRGLILVGLVFVVVLVVFVLPIRPQGGGGGGRDLESLGLKDFIQSEITYDGVMHELYWHYEFANQMIRVARIEDAKAHLRVMSFYVNLLPYLAREKKFFKDPEAVKKFDQYAQDLIKIVDQMIKALGTGSAAEVGKEMEKRISYFCYHCHKDLKTPIRKITPYGTKINMGPGGGRPR